MFSFRSQFKRSRRNYPIPKKTGINDILSALFQNNEQGLIYHIGDFDRYMSELGPELVTGINSAAAWTPYGSNIVENDSGAVKITFVNGSDGAYAYLGSGALSTNLTVGRHYAISGLAKVSAGSSVNISSNSGYGVGLNHATISSTEYVRFTFSILSSSPSLNLLKFLNMGVGESIWVTDISVRELTAINTATLFQDSAGTIPVTAVEQPVGLILDKSKGLVLGPELVTNGGPGFLSTDGWASANATVAATDGKLVCTKTGAAAAVYWGLSTTVGKWYSIEFTWENVDAIAPNILVNSANGLSITTSKTAAEVRFLAVSTSTFVQMQLGSGVVGTSARIISLSTKELPGNHASQATTTARGVLRARYNLLTYSEDFSNPAWIKAGSPTLTNLGEGVWRLQANAGGSWLLYQNVPRLAPEICKFAIDVKSNGSGLDAFRTMLKGISTQNFAAAEGWTRIVVTGLNDGSGSVGIIHRDNAAIDILIRFPDLRPADLPTSLPPYQRIAAATDYDTVGFPVYLEPDGTDDSYVTGRIDFTATDKMTIWAGLRKVDDTARMLCELSTNVNVNNGSFAVVTGNDVDSFYQSSSRGNATSTALLAGKFTTGLYPAPDSAVITAQHDIAGDLSRIRRNGSSAGAIDGTADKGEGNFGNYPLYLFSRGGTSLRFKGPFYSLVIRGAATDTETIEKMAQVINSAMKGVY